MHVRRVGNSYMKNFFAGGNLFFSLLEHKRPLSLVCKIQTMSGSPASSWPPVSRATRRSPRRTRLRRFVAALTAIAEHMCAEHAGDGEGATHLITCEVTHAPDLKTARAVSRSVVCSNLFKAAVFGRDANWGRILCAIGYTPGDFSIDKVCVWLSSAAGEVYVCENAAYHPYSEDEAAKVLAEHDILVKVDMGTGDASAKAWGCDLTYDYVKINGDYRT